MSAYSSFVNPMDVYTSVVMAAIGQIIAFDALLAGSFGALCLLAYGGTKGFDWKRNWVGKRTTKIIAVGALIVGAVGALYLSGNGCSPSFDWKGRWVGQRDVRITPGTAPEIANSIKRVTLEVKPNWEYVLNASGVPSNGMFHPSGKKATLEPVNRLSRPVKEEGLQISLTANEDGTITLSSPDNLDSGPILLRRESQPASSNVRNP